MRTLFIVLAILLCSCSTTGKQPAQHDFGLLASANKTAQPEISVTMPQWLWNQCIHYRLLYSSPTQLSCYSLDQWIAPPPELFKQLLVSKLTTKHRLMIELNEFEQQFDSPNTARVVMNLHATIHAANSEKPIASQNFHLEQTSATPNAAGAVAGFSHLTRQAADKIQFWLNSIANQVKL